MSRKLESVPNPDMGLEQVKGLVAGILNFITADRSRLTRFLQVADFQLETVREAAQSPLFMLTVLAAVAKDEQLLNSLTEHEQVTPEMIELARARLAFQVSMEVAQQGQREQEAAAIRAKVLSQLRTLLQKTRGQSGDRHSTKA